ncbi:MAG: GSCFA domain-containing protein [Chthoniobacteraceae bacterium]
MNQRKFLARDSRIFSIGSCFALNVNRWLQFQGFSVPSVTWGMHYNTRTILYELQRAAGVQLPSFDWVVRKSDGSKAYVDALRHCIDASTPEELAGLKAAVSSETRRCFEAADSFLITLGLSDIWEVDVGGQMIALNRAPYQDALSSVGPSQQEAFNRFLTVQECTEDIVRIVDTIRKNKQPNIPIVLTVSPVPLKHASRYCHPHIANSRSKATLLSAVFSFIERDACDQPVSYFPSFEFFDTNPLKIDLWQRDGRHPTAQAISCVAEHFVKAYSLAHVEIKPGFSVPIFD